MDRPGIWQRAGMTGVVVGLDMANALAARPDHLSAALCVTLLSRAEIATVAAAMERATEHNPEQA
jgi:hypothetical protein